MPVLEEIRSKVSPMRTQGDSLFIACAGFEDRSTAVVQRLSQDYAVDRAVVFRSKEYAAKGRTEENYATLRNILGGASRLGQRSIEFHIDRPIAAMAEFQRLCAEWNDTQAIQSITIDISTFPRQEMLMTLRIVDSLPWQPDVRLLYAEPERYSSELPGGWLTRGVRSVRSVPGFGGIQPPRKRKLLVIFLGHEPERAAITWKRHQAKMSVAIKPGPSYREELNGITETTHSLLFTELGAANVLAPIPARGVREAEAAVLALWQRYHESYFLVVAPLGTKLQTLGIYRAARLKNDMQITYAVPSLYNFNNYSTGVGPLWKIKWR
jgi:hypothetical protein